MRRWLNDENRKKGCTAKNLEYIRKLRELETELKRIMIMNYFLLNQINLDEVAKNGIGTMLRSAKKQVDLMFSVCEDLKIYKVDTETQVRFDKDISKVERRIEYIFQIVKENLRLTKYWVYFNSVGFEKLLDVDFVDFKLRKKYETSLDYLLPEIEQFNKDHEKEITEYLESIREEKETIENFRKKKREDYKQEKQAERERKKEENEYVKEIKNNEKKYKSRQRMIEKSFEIYYK